MDTALKYLSHQAYTRSKLASKLERAGFDETETTECLARLEQWGYLNDREYAAQRIIELQNRLKSRAYVASDLEAQGLALKLINELLSQYYPEEMELAIARKLLQKKPASKNKSLGILTRGGFSENTILKCFPDLST